jgi:STE24 endopeptidase
MAFKTANISFYAGIVFFSLVYRPISLVFDVISNWISRYNEYQADNFAVQTHRHPAAFIEALKKLTVENLSNLNPHPLKVFFDYSHPPILARINKIREKNIEFN